MIDLFDVLVNLVGKYLIEKLCIYFHQSDCSVVCFFLYVYSYRQYELFNSAVLHVDLGGTEFGGFNLLL